MHNNFLLPKKMKKMTFFLGGVGVGGGGGVGKE